jgi:hypothetical protein
MILILLLNSFPGLVSEDDCRKAVHSLNVLRLQRVEILEDGYDVSDIYAIYRCTPNFIHTEP